jgi:hypothetical protein
MHLADSSVCVHTSWTSATSSNPCRCQDLTMLARDQLAAVGEKVDDVELVNVTLN